MTAAPPVTAFARFNPAQPGARGMKIAATGLLLVMAAIFLAARAYEQVGPWVMTCRTDPMTDRSDCTLRHRLWLELPDLQRASSVGVAFEIVLRDGQALPAVTARALSLSDPQRGALAVGGAVEMRLDAEPAMVMPCTLEGRDAICAPEPGETSARAAPTGSA